MARTNESSHPALSHLDGWAAAWSDLLLLVGRAILGWLFLASGWGKLGNIAGATTYLNSFGFSPPEAWAWAVGSLEVLLGVTLIFGIATRYAALASFIFVLIATAVAHRYWAYPAPAQGGQYVQFLKNLAIMGGALAILVTGGGRYSADAKLAKR